MDTRVDQVLDMLALPEIPPRGRERLIGVAMRLFYAHGINAVGLDRVIDGAGISKTAFYKHFESKDDLVVATLEARDAWDMGAWRDAVRVMAGDEPRAQLLGLVDVLDVLFNDPCFMGCQFINAAAEFPDPRDPVHQAAAAHKRAARDLVRDLARAAGAEDPELFADTYTLLFEGTLVLRQVHDRDDAARVARPVLERLIDAHCAGSRNRGR
jgi:AcrR family transcriptional regulator